MIALGGNDINYHERKNPNPKTPAETAAKIFSCQYDQK